MSDFKLDSTGDLDVSSGGLEIVTGVDAVAQEATIRAKQVQGNWWLDLSEGIPYFSRIFINGPNEADIYQIYSAEFRAVTDVLKIQFLQLLNPTPNSMTVRATLLTPDGVAEVDTQVL